MSAIAPITDVGTVKSAGWQDLDGLDDAVLDRCFVAATAEIETICAPRRFAAANYALPYDGSSAKGRFRHLLYLDHYPLISVTSLKENGVMLVSGTGYDASGAFDVLLYLTEGILARKKGTATVQLADFPITRVERAWYPGLQNVEASYRAGFEDPVNEISDLVQACIKLAVLYYKSPRRQGQTSTSRQSGQTTFIQDLADSDRAAILRYAPHGRPRCRLAA